MTSRPRRLPAVVALAVALVAAACGDDDSSHSTHSSEGELEGFPVTVENCGESTTYDAPPERAVAVEQSAIETMLALGLEDSIAGVAHRNLTDLREDLADAYESLPLLSEGEFSRELLLSVSPDFMVSRQESSFAEDRGLSRESLRSAGIASHVVGHDCIEGQLTWEAIYEQVLTLGRIFGVEDRAQQVVDDMASQVAEVEALTEDLGERPRVFFYDTGEDVPFTRGGPSIDTLLIDTAGGENVFADVDDVFAEVSWEEVVDRDPEVIVVLDYGEGSGFEAGTRIDFLEGFPPMQRVAAVREGRIFVLPNQQLLLSARTPEALEVLAEGLHPDSGS